MNRILLSVCFLFFCFVSAKAQNLHSIKGRVIDTLSTSILGGTSIAVLNAKDSTMVKFTRAAENGMFEIGNIGNGKYILLVSYPKYADFVDNFVLDSAKKDLDYGKINLTGKAKILSDVIIKGNRSAIKIKGDTTEFDPAAYNIEPNSKVEDLIKQFPGIQVDKDGKITAQGQTNVKVLVDGEEFFGDDPTLVTKNIRADMVDKVQLFDKKSDQATFTGIDDGVKTKTLNIKLKENAKNGYFGKIDVGVGTDDFYQGQAMFNIFKGKKKFSAYGILGNTGKVGLGWQDQNKYGSTDIQFGDDGGMYISSGGGDDLDSWGGQFSGDGIPVARTGGLHFDNKWNSDKESLNTNYKIGSIRVTGDRTTISQNNLQSGPINTNSDQNFDNDMFRQKLDATYEVKLDTTLTLKVSVDGTLKNSNTKTFYDEVKTRGDNTLQTDAIRNLTNNVKEKSFNATAFLTKRFKKKGRTSSLSLGQSVSDNEANGYLNSTNSFYNSTSTLDSLRLVDQYKNNNITSSTFRSNLTYTEPITKASSITFNYGLSLINGKADRKSFNKSASGQYDQFDTKFSNDFELNQVINQGGAVFNYTKGKSTLNFGSKFSSVDFEQKDVLNNTSYDRNFINYMPQASYTYKFSQQKSLRVSYNGRTNQPTIDQMQPVRNNTDPLNITIGNPDLRPSFASNINASYNSYKVLSGQSIYLYGSYNFTGNAIVSNVVTDNAGKSTFQFTNLADKTTSTYYAYASFSRKVMGVNVGMGLNLDGNTSYNFINNDLNQNKNNNYSANLQISRYKEKKYSIAFYGGPAYNVSTTTVFSGVNKEINSDGWGANASAYGNLYLPGKFEVASDARYTFTGKTQTFNEDFERLIVNASISKKFFKSEELKLVASVNDLLNQNVGFSRSSSNTYITQSNFTTIQRFFLFSIVWDFNKMGGGAKTQK